MTVVVAVQIVVVHDEAPSEKLGVESVK